MAKNLFNDLKLNKQSTTAPVKESVAQNRDYEIEKIVNIKRSAKKMEDTHKRVTFLLDKEYAEIFNDYCDSLNVKGIKTQIVNKMFYDFLNEHDLL